MRTSRPPGMGRRCAPRRQYRPPSGDPHPGDGAMASRPSRRSTTYSRRLRGSSGPRTRIWAPGGLDRQVYQIETSGKRAHAPAPRDTWRSEDPGKSRKAVKAGCKDSRDGCESPARAVVPVGGGGRSLSRPRIPMFHDCQSTAPASLRSPGDCPHVAVAVRLRPGDRRAAVDGCRGRRRDERFPRLSPDPRHGRYAPSDRGLRAPCTRRPWLTRSQNPGLSVSEKDLAETG